MSENNTPLSEVIYARLPRALRDRIDAAADKHLLSRSAEIRQTLARVYSAEPAR
jgi:hypothetical protein